MKSRMRATAPLRNPSQGSRYVNQLSGGKPPKCWICDNSTHWVDQCEKFKSMSPEERLKTVRENHACFSCLKKAGRDHRASNCSRRKQCTQKISGVQCKYYHHVLLNPSNPTASVGVASVENNTETMLPVITVKISGKNNRHKQGNILLDSGAQISLICTSTAKNLDLKGKDVSITIIKVGGEEEVLATRLYQVPITSLESGAKFTVKAVGIPHISDDISNTNIGEMAKGIGIPEVKIYRECGPIDMLIGIDHAYMHNGDSKKVGNVVARHSPLGWIVFGAIPGLQQTSRIFHVQYTRPVDLTDFWTSEAMGVNKSNIEMPKLSKIEQEETKLIEQGCKLIGNRWEMAYPWKTDTKTLPDNREQAVKKMEATEKILKGNLEHAKAYQEQMEQMEDLGFSRKLTEREINDYKGPVHYIAHQEVVRPDKKSTPVRIVFNSSARYKGHCLNDCWIKGPDLLNNMLGVILRFREQPVAVSGDISKMYHRIGIPEEDQHVHRFLWRDMDTTKPPDTYVKTVLTFGDKPAPAMAQIALRKTADQAENAHPYAAEVLKKNTYMDDICDSVPNVECAQQLTKDLDEILDKGGFKVKEWLSNEILEENLPSEERSSVKFLEGESEEKVLGVVWNNSKDAVTFKCKANELSVPSQENSSKLKLTKRKILSKVARVFDPIGFAAAFLIRAKIGLQRLWQQGLDWDEELSSEVSKWWTEFFAEIEDFNNVSFPRSLTPPNTIRLPTLCIFADASRDAFGACSYLRWEKSSGNYESRFISAKSRVAPLKELTIPRLELQAAVLASRLYKTIIEECRLQLERVIFFTDSMIVLTWIRSQSREFKPFVSSRVAEIQTNCDPSTWRHIPSEHNVADDLSRGIPAKDLEHRWKNGPKFLNQPKEE